MLRYRGGRKKLFWGSCDQVLFIRMKFKKEEDIALFLAPFLVYYQGSYVQNIKSFPLEMAVHW